MTTESQKATFGETSVKTWRRNQTCRMGLRFGELSPHNHSGRSRCSNRLLSAILLLLLCLTGCVSKSKAKQNARAAYVEGQQKALAEQQAQQPAVWFRGDIQNPRVPWTEGLTLSQALLSAHYTWNWNPRLITVTRNGEVYTVNAKLLLRGVDDPVLEPGDVIEVHH